MTDWETRYFEAEALHTEARGMLFQERDALKRRLDAMSDKAIALPAISEGELHAGLAFVDGKPSHWLVLLPGDEKMTWPDAVAWAKTQGGALPTLNEQSLLFANVPQAFDSTWYWSGDSDPDYAWCQNLGNRGYYQKWIELRARAVRRVVWIPSCAA